MAYFILIFWVLKWCYLWHVTTRNMYQCSTSKHHCHQKAKYAWWKRRKNWGTSFQELAHLYFIIFPYWFFVSFLIEKILCMYCIMWYIEMYNELISICITSCAYLFVVKVHKFCFISHVQVHIAISSALSFVCCTWISWAYSSSTKLYILRLTSDLYSS
jgi:hypothetical protein